MIKHFVYTFLSLAFVCHTALAQKSDLLLHYDFSEVSGSNVTDQSSSGITARLMNNAKVEQMGKYHVLNLGTSNGYLDMTANAGNIFKGVDEYSVSVYYLVNKNASLDGNGHFLWAFSTSSACGSTSGKYSAYRLNAQRYATSTGGYTNESGIETGASSIKGKWIHVVYTEKDGTGNLYINGELVGTNANMPTNSTNYGSATITYCWLGRPPFSGDNYLKQTLLTDFRLYGKALSADEIATLTSQRDQLEYDYYHGTPGNPTTLKAAIQAAQNAINDGNDYLLGAVADVEDMIMRADQMASSSHYSQVAYDEIAELLTSTVAAMKATRGMIFDYSSITDVYDIDRGFKHPSGLHTQEDFNRIKRQLSKGNSRVTAAYNILKNAAYAQPNVATYPTEVIVRGGGVGENYINAARGATMAYQNALRWRIEGNTACANAAVRILMAWANTTKDIGGDSNYALAAGLYGYQFAQAAELMRDYDGWAADDFETFKQWMLTVWYPKVISFLRGRNGTWENAGKWWQAPGHYWSNWGLCNVLALINIGILCDDVFIYNQGMSYFKYDQVGTFRDPRTDVPIRNDGLTEFLGNLVVTTADCELETGAYGKLGQMQESGRDTGHSALAAGLMVDIAKVGWNQGDDLFAYMDHRLAAGIEYVAAQTQSVADLPWTNYHYATSGYYYSDSRSWIQTEPALGAQMRPYWGTVIGIYEGVKGVKMPFSEVSYDNMGIDGGGLGGTSGGYDHLGYSVLMNTRDEQLASSNMIPTELTPRMEYDGTIVEHNELGGLSNTYIVNNHTGVPVGTVINLMPQLPVNEENTGIWQWDTGETSQNITVTAHKSHLYRVTYTNKDGIQSQQVFAIAVQGDCQPTQVTPSIIHQGITYDGINDIFVAEGETVTLSISPKDGYGTIEWDNGKTTPSITTLPLVRNRDYSVAYLNQGGMPTVLTFHVTVRKKGDVNGDGLVNISDAVALVGYILGEKPYVFYEDAADLNDDGIINITDVTSLISIILNNGSEE